MGFAGAPPARWVSPSSPTGGEFSCNPLMEVFFFLENAAFAVPGRIYRLSWAIVAMGGCRPLSAVLIERIDVKTLRLTGSF